MIDGTDPLVRALIARLREDETLTAMSGWKIYDTPPPRKPGVDRQANFTSIGPTDANPWSRGEKRGCSVFVQIDNWAEVSEAGVTHARRARLMNAATIASIWGRTLPTITGWTLHHLWLDGIARVVRDPNGVTAHGIVPIRADMTPDDNLIPA